MNIETKYNINDIVYIPDNMNIVQYRIDTIKIEVFDKDDIRILYSLRNDREVNVRIEYEFKAFKTIDECKQYMIKCINNL